MMNGNKITQSFVTVFFLSVLTVFCLGTIFSQKREVSQQEKRQLAQLRAFSWNLSSLREWPKNLNLYLNDHFFHREDLVFLNALPRVKFLRRAPSFLVSIGKDDWYFFNGDWVLHDFLRKPDQEGVARAQFWEKLLTLRQRRLQQAGVHYLVAAAPNKESVYPEFLPERIAQRAGTPMLEEFAAHMRESPMADHFLDLGDSLKAAKAGGRVYFKTDTHWNERGAYFAYRAIIEKLRKWYPDIVPLAEEGFEKRAGENSAGGDIVFFMGLRGAIAETGEERWLRLSPCAKPKDRIVTTKSLPVGKTLLANGCPTAIPLRLLVISDSFGPGLRGYLSETFQDVVFCRDFNLPDLQGFIAEYRPDVVLDLRVARYLPNLMTPGPDEKI
ncbi:MAG: hypothetical protein HGB11_13885 [Chlorobiales bacterium]|nr:hypothetical protein [Chlorobiales bacterium]